MPTVFFIYSMPFFAGEHLFLGLLTCLPIVFYIVGYQLVYRRGELRGAIFLLGAYLINLITIAILFSSGQGTMAIVTIFVVTAGIGLCVMGIRAIKAVPEEIDIAVTLIEYLSRLRVRYLKREISYSYWSNAKLRGEDSDMKLYYKDGRDSTELAD